MRPYGKMGTTPAFPPHQRCATPRTLRETAKVMGFPGFSEENDGGNKAIKMLQLVFVLVFSDTYDEASHCR